MDKSNWNQIKGKIKETFSKLTDDDLAKLAGKKDELIGKLQSLYGEAKDSIKLKIDNIELQYYNEQLKFHWNQLKNELHKRWEKLTNEDIEKIKGDSKILIEDLQKRYNLTRQKAEEEFHNFIDSIKAFKGKK